MGRQKTEKELERLKDQNMRFLSRNIGTFIKRYLSTTEVPISTEEELIQLDPDVVLGSLYVCGHKMEKRVLQNLVLKGKQLEARSSYKVVRQFYRARQYLRIPMWNSIPTLSYLSTIEPLAVCFSKAISSAETYIKREKNVLRRKELLFSTFVIQLLKFSSTSSSSISSIEFLSSGIFKLNLYLSIRNLILFLTGQSTQFRNPQIITKNPYIISGITLLIRQNEINRIIQILTRREKCNIILIGESGIGKASLVYGMAHLFIRSRYNKNIQEKLVLLYRHLCLKKIVEIDQFDLVVPHFLSRRQRKPSFISKLLKESKKLDNLIVFMRDIHILLSTTDLNIGINYSLLSTDMVQLRSALNKNQIQGIGTTDRVLFNKCMDHIPAWKRIFTTILVAQPTEELLITIVKKKLEGYKQYYSLLYGKKVIKSSIALASRYIATAPLPDRVLDILDEAGAYRTYIRARNISKSQKLDRATPSKETDNNNVTLKTSFRLFRLTVTEQDIAIVVALKTGVDCGQVSKQELSRLNGLEEYLTKHVIGQDRAATTVTQALRRSRVGLNDPQRPIAIFMFCGPTGVGKTQLTKLLAQFYFGKKESLIRFDMSEYKERHTAAKLIGAPPGYIGYEEGGTLTMAVRYEPHSLILFDEVEKGHISVYDLLLQVFDDGRLTDNRGVIIDFSNTLIIMTSNLGSNLANITGKTPALIYEELSVNVHEALKEHFRPEFLNRLDEVVIFVPLGKSEIKQILDLRLTEVTARLKESNSIDLVIGQKLKAEMVNQGYDPLYGARPLRRAIVKLLIDPLADALLDETLDSIPSCIAELTEEGTTLVTTNSR